MTEEELEAEEVEKCGSYQCTEEGIDFYKYGNRLVGVEDDEIHSNAYWPRNLPKILAGYERA